METKLLIGVVYAIGVPSWIWGILLNMGTWKADVLFIVSMAISLVYFVFMVRKLIDMDTIRKLNIKEKQREFDKGKGDPPGPQEKLNDRIDRMNDDIHRNFR